MVQQNLVAATAGEILAHRPGPVSGRLLPGPRPYQHQIRSGALESGARATGERAADCHRDSVLLVRPQHQIEAALQFFRSVVNNRSSIIKHGDLAE